MAQKQVVYIISNLHKSLAFEWIASRLKNDYKLAFILLNPAYSDLEDFLVRQQIEVKHILYRGKKDFIIAFFKTFVYLLFKRPHIIHAHLLDAQLIGLTTAWLARIKKRIYTRHNSNYHHIYHPRGVRFDNWSNRMATNIISISQATDETLLQLEKVASSKVIKIPHGFELNIFSEVSEERSKAVREKWKIQKSHPVVGVIARHIEWKGIQFIIPAFQKFLNENPGAILILANATGPFNDEINKLLKQIPEGHVICVPFEEEVAALYSIFDLYVHVPIDPICEAFGQTYVEALAAGVPSIFTLSGIAAEFIENERNALVVRFKNENDIYNSLSSLWGNRELRTRLVNEGRKDVFSKFRIEPMLLALKKLYDK